MNTELNVVTGALGYSGRYITRRLLDMGKRVRTLTGHPERENPFGEQVEVAAYNFDNPAELAKCLEGATVLYNTYWIRFAYGDMTFDQAVANTKSLVSAAEAADVRRIVHISITNPSIDSPLPYYKGKAQVEDIIKASKLSYGILRPNVLFGDQGILLNNIAWLLRRMPVFTIPGDGTYKLQPIYIEDLADLAIDLGRKEENIILDAVGPEIYTFNDLASLMRKILGSRSILIHLNPGIARFMSTLLGYVVGDVMLTEHEVQGLMTNLLVSDQTPTGKKKLSEWFTENADWLGTKYMSEVKKHYK